MKELSKEDQERIENAAERYSPSRIYLSGFIEGAEYEHHIAFEKGKIESKKEVDELKEALRQEKESHDSTFRLMLSSESRGVEKGKIEGFNKGIEAVKKAFEEIEKLKKK